MDQVPTTDTPGEFEHVLTFTARRGPLFGLLIVNALLTVITLGIYRFWAKTKVRRFFWHNIRLMDDPLEYTGTGGELFLGFLIVIAVLFPLGMIYGAIRTLVPPEQGLLRIGLEVLYYLTLFALLQIGFYRMWRYRMSRTVWRGVRFGLDGSSWSFLKLAAGWTLLTAVTLGAAYPWMKIDLWRYQVTHTRLGDQAFRFDGEAKPLLVPWLFYLLPFLVLVGCIAGLAATGAIPTPGNEIASEKRPTALLLTFGAGLIWLFFFSPFVYLWFRVRLARIQISGVQIGKVSFASTLPYGRLLLFYVLTGLAFLAFLVPIGAVIFTTLGGQAGTLQSGELPSRAAGLVFGIAILFALFSIIVAPIITMALAGFEVVKQTVITTTIDNPTGLENAAQRISETPRTGEGLADALDIGGF